LLEYWDKKITLLSDVELGFCGDVCSLEKQVRLYYDLKKLKQVVFKKKQILETLRHKKKFIWRVEKQVQKNPMEKQCCANIILDLEI
jgi:hypothetical protein